MPKVPQIGANKPFTVFGAWRCTYCGKGQKKARSKWKPDVSKWNFRLRFVLEGIL